MKGLVTIVALGLLMSVVAKAGDSYHKPFEEIEPSDVVRVDIAVVGVAKPIRVADREWITRFLGSISPKDYPMSKGPMTFSLPSEVATIRLLGEDEAELIQTKLYGAWNLLLSGTGDTHVLGSSKKTSAIVLAKIEGSHPEKLKAWRHKYRGNLSGVYETEYRDALKSEQGGVERP